MTETATPQEEVRKLIEQMVEAREAMNVQRDRLNDLRREARSEGLNLQALNPLVDIMGEHSHDRGVKVLHDMQAYAAAAGVGLLPGALSGGETRGTESTAAQVGPDGPPAAASESAEQSKVRAPARPWARTAWHGGLAIAISALLIWLLH